MENNPREKANSLIEKFRRYTPTYADAIECALILCDSHIVELEELRKPEYTTFILKYTVFDADFKEIEPAITMDGYEKIDFWQSVRKELELLKS